MDVQDKKKTTGKASCSLNFQHSAKTRIKQACLEKNKNQQTTLLFLIYFFVSGILSVSSSFFLQFCSELCECILKIWILRF